MKAWHLSEQYTKETTQLTFMLSMAGFRKSTSCAEHQHGGSQVQDGQYIRHCAVAVLSRSVWYR